jgi:hypothetical protein
MADPSRFPQLALPFAITGACAGWLSGTMVSNPLFGFQASPPFCAALATAMATLTGAALTRACIGRRYKYEMGEPNPDLRPATDVWPLQAGLVLVAGAATGWLLAALTPGCCTEVECVLGGIACALAFVPVCLAVIGAARRAQRARLGSIVAASDRRAVWAILAMLLAVMTLEGALDWPAWSWGLAPPPFPVLGMLGAAALSTLGILVADRRALARARDAVARGLAVHDPEEAAAGAVEPARVDLGIGDELLSRVERGAAGYRQRARTVALVKGSPDRALSALRRSVRRGFIALFSIGAVAAIHACACSGMAFTAYGFLICGPYYAGACEITADRLADSNSVQARMLRARARAWALEKGPAPDGAPAAAPVP